MAANWTFYSLDARNFQHCLPWMGYILQSKWEYLSLWSKFAFSLCSCQDALNFTGSCQLFDNYVGALSIRLNGTLKGLTLTTNHSFFLYIFCSYPCFVYQNFNYFVLSLQQRLITHSPALAFSWSVCVDCIGRNDAAASAASSSAQAAESAQAVLQCLWYLIRPKCSWCHDCRILENWACCVNQ